ncbi:MAG: hypothetical protein NTW05_03760 [Pseudonocardiales bacterium]|nr:hypothetical protein [Pseudonocardiales bacterium]
MDVDRCGDDDGVYPRHRLQLAYDHTGYSIAVQEGRTARAQCHEVVLALGRLQHRLSSTATCVLVKELRIARMDALRRIVERMT